MNRRLLIITSGHPAQTDRTAEAIRIAAGICVWQKTEVAICLRREAAAVLEEHNAPEFAEAHRHLEMLEKHRQTILVETTPDAPFNGIQSPIPFRAVNTQTLAAIAADCSSVLHF